MITWKNREKSENFTWNAWLDRDRLMCAWITDDIHSIADLGAGGMVLKKMLPDSIVYYPVDYTARSSETIIADFNNYEFPNISVDCCFCAGILEYVKDLDWFASKISHTGCNYLLLSYCVKTPDQSIANRRNHAWVNDFSFEELLTLFYRNGFILTDWKKHYEFSPLLKFERATSLSLSRNYFCTGCSACVSSCTTGALIMHPDENGFLKPALDMSKCIQCNKCLSACHVLNKCAIKNNLPHAYGLWASDDIRKGSSSGGAFSLLAKKILSQGGVVFGAAWNDDFTVGHCYITKEQELPMLMHSKYLQSSIGESYIKAKAFLAMGKLVLFSGTPCQIAGLYAFLGKNDSHLVTIDLLCHYVPSTKYFKKYLDENFGKDSVRLFTFRDKHQGWNFDNMRIELKNGEIITRNFRNDKLQQGFHTRLFMNEVCAECEYADIPRIGDITIGDLWGLVDDPEWNDGKGSSQLLINTKQGEKLFDCIVSECKKCQQIPLDITYANRIKQKYCPHPEQGHFQELILNHTFNESVDRALNKKFDIGLVGDWSVENYGANITYYALYSVLHDQMKKDVLMIERPLCAPWRPKTPPTLFLNYPIRPIQLHIMLRLERRCLNLMSSARALSLVPIRYGIMTFIMHLLSLLTSNG